MTNRQKIGLVLATLAGGALLLDRRASRRLSGLSLPGGKAHGRSPWQFSPDQFIRGMQVEMEHTDDWCIAGQIVMDHLVENPNYYADGLPHCPGGEVLVCKNGAR